MNTRQAFWTYIKFKRQWVVEDREILKPELLRLEVQWKKALKEAAKKARIDHTYKRSE